MPNYKTHSIHGELILKEMDKKTEINKEDIKSYCMGPDAIIITDYKTFDFQHANKTKEFFMELLKIIKNKKLQDNSEVMAFLYGQLDHFVLDCIMHPLIYYMTEGIEAKHKIKPHGLIESWIDDYTTNKYNKNEDKYYNKYTIKDKELIKVINEIYNRVYNSKYGAKKYSIGMAATAMYDVVARRNLIKIAPIITKLVNIGDITYSNDLKRVLPYLNLNNEEWYNPETGEKYTDSFDDLWDKSNETILETIKDINNYLYKDESITNPLISNNISFNTGIPCEKGQNFSYIKKYK